MAGAAKAALARLRKGRVRAIARGRSASAPPATASSCEFDETALAAAREAVERLARDRPAASAKLALERRLWPSALAAIAVAAIFVLASRDLEIFALLAAAGFLLLIGFRIAALASPGPERAPPGASRADPPLYSILVPLHREAEVVANLVAALKRLDYPVLCSKSHKIHARSPHKLS